MKYKPSPRFAEYVRKVMGCGHWIDNEQLSGSDCGTICHISSGAVLAYQLHDGGNEYNSARNFATAAGRVCGCKFVESRGRKKSRKRIDFYDDEAQRIAARTRGDQAERDALMSDLREACEHAQRTLRANPTDVKVRSHYDRLRAQLAAAMEKSA